MKFVVEVRRVFNNDRYCISHVYADGVYVCDAIEDTDRGFDSSMSDYWIRKHKVAGKTAIPIGEYTVTLNVVSPTFSKKLYYRNFCGGKLPRLLYVKGFDGILWHRGITERDSAGCLILGYNTIKGQVTNSQEAFEKLYKILQEADKRGDEIIAKYTRTYKV